MQSLSVVLRVTVTVAEPPPSGRVAVELCIFSVSPLSSSLIVTSAEQYEGLPCPAAWPVCASQTAAVMVAVRCPSMRALSITLTGIVIEDCPAGMMFLFESK